jgi:hypothetical protein
VRYLRTWKSDHSGPTEGHTGVIACLELWCATDELGELWSVEYDLTEEDYIQQVE